MMARDAKRAQDGSKKGGKVFYEDVAVALPRAIHFPKIGVATLEFLESIIIFLAGTVEVLLISRLIILESGANGGNLLTFLLYALSYPFVSILASSQGQIPVKSDGFVFEMFAVMFMYFVASYVAMQAIRFFGEEKEIVRN